MSNFFVSTSSVSAPVRSSAMRIQAELARRQKELSTGRVADAGLALGTGSGETLTLGQTKAWQDAVSGTNALAMSRLDASQSALTAMVASAQKMQDQFVGAQGSTVAAASAPEGARSALGALISHLNSSISGTFVFGGDNGAGAVVSGYFDTGSQARQNIAADFATTFGMPQDSSGVSSITPDAMTSFLDTVLAPRFTDASWRADWSQASSTNPTLRISTEERIEIGANANEQSFRDLAQAFVMVSDLGSSNLRSDTFNVVLQKATTLVSSALNGLAAIQSRLGTTQGRITAAEELRTDEGAIVANRLGKLQDADPYVATTAINDLMTKLQASYAATARIQQLSIVNYM